MLKILHVKWIIQYSKLNHTPCRWMGPRPQNVGTAGTPLSGSRWAVVELGTQNRILSNVGHADSNRIFKIFAHNVSWEIVLPV